MGDINHWIVISTIDCKRDEIEIYDSLQTIPELYSLRQLLLSIYIQKIPSHNNNHNCFGMWTGSCSVHLSIWENALKLHGYVHSAISNYKEETIKESVKKEKILCNCNTRKGNTSAASCYPCIRLGCGMFACMCFCREVKLCRCCICGLFSSACGKRKVYVAECCHRLYRLRLRSLYNLWCC